MKTAAQLKEIYDNARKVAEIKYPGSVVAGPANYPVARHDRAWQRVHKIGKAYLRASQKEAASIAYQQRTERLAIETNAIISVSNNPLNGMKVGDLLRLFWTNCGKQHSAIVAIVKFNAKTVNIKLVSNIPDGYQLGQSWSVDKLTNTVGNRFEKIA